MDQSVFSNRAYNVCWLPYKRSAHSEKGARDVCLVSIWLDFVSFDIRRKNKTHARLCTITLRAFVYARLCLHLLQSKQTEKCFSDWLPSAFTVNLRSRTSKRTTIVRHVTCAANRLRCTQFPLAAFTDRNLFLFSQRLERENSVKNALHQIRWPIQINAVEERFRFGCWKTECIRRMRAELGSVRVSLRCSSAHAVELRSSTCINQTADSTHSFNSP